MKEELAGGFAHEMRNALGAADVLAASRGQTNSIQETEQAARVLLALCERLPPGDARDSARAAVATLVEHVLGADDVIQGMRRGIGRAMRLTTQVLDYARCGTMQPAVHAVDLTALLREALQEVETNPRHAHITVQVTTPAALILCGDETYLFCLVQNLLRNACEAMDGIDASVARLEVHLEASAAHWTLRVRDTGSGIAGADRAHIFEPFFTTKPETGTGLGLAMVRKIVDLYAGVLTHHDAAPRGTEFTVRLPATY